MILFSKNRNCFMRQIYSTFGLVSLIFTYAFPCSAVFIRDAENCLLGMNYDYYYSQGMIFSNHINVKKIGLSDKPELAIEWISKFGSLTFCQFGKELPTGGMNEKGLSIQLLYAENVNKINKINSKSLNELQWIQFQLDNYATVDEVIKNLDRLKISISFMPLKYSVCDSSGKIAFIEPSKDKLIYYYPEAHNSVLTNSEYKQTCTWAQKKRGSSLNVKSSEERFLILKRAVEAYLNIQKPALERSLFEIMDKARIYYKPSLVYLISPPTTTQWQIVYNPSKRLISFRTQNSDKIGCVDVKKINYKCESIKMAFNIEDLTGDSLIINSRLKEYSDSDNAEIIYKSYASVSNLFPQAVQDSLVLYPSLLECAK